jgi:hypothetical protein
VAADWRDDRIAKLERELAREDAELAMKDGATLERLEVTLDRLRKLRHRIDQRQLEHDDWVLLGALVRETT